MCDVGCGMQHGGIYDNKMRDEGRLETECLRRWGGACNEFSPVYVDEYHLVL